MYNYNIGGKGKKMHAQCCSLSVSGERIIFIDANAGCGDEKRIVAFADREPRYHCGFCSALTFLWFRV